MDRLEFNIRFHIADGSVNLKNLSKEIEQKFSKLLQSELGNINQRIYAKEKNSK